MPILGAGSLSPTTQPSTFRDIYTEVLNRMRQLTTQSSIIEQAKRYVNTALYDMVIGFEYKLPWLEREAFLTTMAPYTTGTVAITRGSTSLVGVSTAWDTVNAYGVANARSTGKITLGDNNIYTIASVDSATGITLNQRYIADSDLAAGATYTYFEDEYALASDFLKPIDYRRFSAALNIPIIGRHDFRRLYPRPNVSGMPRAATLYDKPFASTSTPQIHVQFYPYPNAVLMIPYAYVTSNLAVSTAGVEAAQMSADTDEPILPIRYRHAIVLHAIAQWYRDKKDDTRSEPAKAEYQDEVSRLVGDQRIGANTTAQITPKVGLYHSRPYSGGRRRYSTNNSFDDFRT